MKRLFLSSILLGMATGIYAQLIRIQPENAGAADQVTLIYDAGQGDQNLQGESKIYLHAGVITSGTNGTDWQYVQGNWGEDDGVGLMRKVEDTDHQWSFTFSPSIRSYFQVPASQAIFRLALVFRDVTGEKKGSAASGEYSWGSIAANGDIFIDLQIDNYISVTTINQSQIFLDADRSLRLSAEASSMAEALRIELDDGAGFREVARVESGRDISYDYVPDGPGQTRVRYSATINGEDLVEIRTHQILLKAETTVAAVPDDQPPGIHYHPTDPTRATLVLEAPGKSFVMVAGDFNDWLPGPEYQMHQSPDEEFFWLELENLEPGRPYVFQYWVDGEIRIGDPYAEQVADPWHDCFIPESVFPNLPAYDKTEFGIATVLQTGQEPYRWDPSEANWQRPDVDHLVIYELLLRDFLASHSFQALADTLQYIKDLGVDAIEIMPFNEFEGNESWGYNPSYYFAVDKYYGHKDDLKRFVELAHQAGLAVIMDVVMNHAFGQNPMVMLYFDHDAGKPSAENPWFNREYVGQYQWGYDFNHESPYTQAFLDRLNRFWLEEYHLDGYRFDFTKGFTNQAPGGSIDGFDQSRINLLKRMADSIRTFDPEAYLILEHWSPDAEERILGNLGMKMWRNRSYDFVPAVVGDTDGELQAIDALTHVSFYNSHDERRIAEHALTEGRSYAAYHVREPVIMYERVKLAAAFCYLQPGPKMIWQFDELAYDIDINLNGRTGNKPLPWGPDGLGYYEDPLRQQIYRTYQALLTLRRQIGPENLALAETRHQLSGPVRSLVYEMEASDLVLIGNFSIKPQSYTHQFPHAGTWYNYFSEDSLQLEGRSRTFQLQAGEWHIFTTKKWGEGIRDAVSTYGNPVSISPFPFGKRDTIRIRFDAQKAWPGGSQGLIGAEKVYMHAGLVLSDFHDRGFGVEKGTGTDDGIGIMEKVGEDLWEISLVPQTYFGLEADQVAYRLGMYFRDAENRNFGYGFQNTRIFYNIASDIPIVQVDPPAFQATDEITITFNAAQGNRELQGADQVYLHSGVGLEDRDSPGQSAWQNVVGNWGQDDGIGRMQRLPENPDLWEIKLIPQRYYRLREEDRPYWLAMVFRNADGNTKGTAPPGPFEYGFIDENLDFFFRNQIDFETIREDLPEDLSIYPNPTIAGITIEPGALENLIQEIRLINTRGQVLHRWSEITTEKNIRIDLWQVPAGLYYIQINTANQSNIYKIIKQ